MTPAYPDQKGKRDDWVLAQRPPADAGDPRQPAGALREAEPDGNGGIADVFTILLRNQACPWKCLMCDLWRHATQGPVTAGAIPAQMETGLRLLGSAKPTAIPTSSERWLKLYNGGSFFDRSAIPESDYRALAEFARDFDRIVLECHPALVGTRLDSFLAILEQAAGGSPRTVNPRGTGAGLVRLPASSASPRPEVEVAMGLECVHPTVLAKLNKGMTLDSFRRAAERLRKRSVDLRAFVLVQPPFLTEAEAAVEWAVRSAAFAFDAGARVVSLIPTRPGNGALDELARQGLFRPPALATLEQAVDGALALGRGIILTDVWDLERFAACPRCFPARRRRLQAMNLGQQALPRERCPACASIA